MSASTPEPFASVADLRRLLAEKFPTAAPKPGGVLPTGLPAVDGLEGGLRRAALTELSTTSGAGALFIGAMLQAVRRAECFAALVDPARSFEPGASSPGALAHLLVVFCKSPMQGVQATDLLLRDGNLSLVMLDLQAAPARDLQRIPANAWHRLQRLAEQTAAAIVVLTRQPTVEAAQVRIATQQRWTLDAQRHRQRDLLAEMPWQVFPRRTFGRNVAPVLQQATA